MARPPFAAVAASEPPLPPRFAFVKSPAWEHAEPVTREAFAELVECLGEAVVRGRSRRELRARASTSTASVMEVEMAHNLHRDYEQGRDQLSAPLRELIERGRTLPGGRLHRARSPASPRSTQALDYVFDEYDAILTPAAPGEAPRGLESTGNPIFCTIWTYLGTPAITLPLLQSEAGLPLGVQLVGAPRQRCAPLAHGALACQNCRASRAAVADARPRRGTEASARRREEEIVMTNLITGIIGLAMVMTFLGFMVVWVPAPPLIIIMVGVMILAVVDFVQSLRGKDTGAGR